MLPIIKRPYRPTDKNFILNSYIRSNSGKHEIEGWQYRKLHDIAKNNITSSTIVVLEDNDDTIIAYQLGTYTYIKHKFREYSNEINNLLSERK